MGTVLDAAAHKRLGPKLYDEVNRLIRDYETGNEHLDAHGVKAVLKVLWPEGRSDVNADAWDAVKFCLDTELKRQGIPTSEAAKELLTQKQMQEADNFNTFLDTEAERLKQEYKSAYLATQRNGLTGNEYMRASNWRSSVTAEIIMKLGSSRGADVIVEATIAANADLARGGQS